MTRTSKCWCRRAIVTPSLARGQRARDPKTRLIWSDRDLSVRCRNGGERSVDFIISERDITEERVLTAQLSHLALHDPLTGLANRALFDDRLAPARARVVRQGGLGAVLLLDLDDFEGVNDSLGHLARDKLPGAIARRLEQVTRASDSLCRFGGDEFNYLAEGLTSPGEAEGAARRLPNKLVEPFSIAGAQLALRASIGIVVWDEKSANCGEIVQHADVALFEAKRAGKGHQVIFDPERHHQPSVNWRWWRNFVTRFTPVNWSRTSSPSWT